MKNFRGSIFTLVLIFTLILIPLLMSPAFAGNAVIKRSGNQTLFTVGSEDGDVFVELKPNKTALFKAGSLRYETNVIENTSTATARTLVEGESGSMCVIGARSGSTIGTITFNLPEAKIGLNYTFAENDATTGCVLAIHPASGDEIEGRSTDRTYTVRGDELRQGIKLEAVSASEWVVVSERKAPSLAIITNTSTATARALLPKEMGSTCLADAMAGVTAGAITFNLPAAEPGMMFTFIDDDITTNTNLTIQAATGDKINGGSAGKAYKCTGQTDAETLTILAIDDTNWVILSKMGTWANDNS